MEYGGKPCTRCLLAEAGNRSMAELIAQRIAVIPDEKRAVAALYKQRLDICLSCESLSAGICVKCGCYVELRAAGADGYCPNGDKKW